MPRYTILLSTFHHAGTVKKTATSKKQANAECDELVKDGARLMGLGENDLALVRIFDSKSKSAIKIIRQVEVSKRSHMESCV